LRNHSLIVSLKRENLAQANSVEKFTMQVSPERVLRKQNRMLSRVFSPRWEILRPGEKSFAQARRYSCTGNSSFAQAKMALEQECSLDYFCSSDKFLNQARLIFALTKLFSLKLKYFFFLFFPSSFLFFLFYFFIIYLFIY